MPDRTPTTPIAISAHRQLAGFQLAIDLAVQTQVLALYGPSGSGKSLTLRCIAGVLPVDRGRIVIGDQTLFDSAARIDRPPEARRVGYLPQHYALFPHLTVSQNVAFGLGRISRVERTRRVGELLELLDLGALADRRPAEISGGQQQRVGLARALAIQPLALLLDEPFTALDPPLRRTLRRELLSLSRRFATPIIIATHDLADVLALGGTLAVIAEGRVRQVGDAGQVIRAPATPQVARIVGARNLLSGRVAGQNDHTVQIECGTMRLHAPASSQALGNPVNIVVAPAAIRLIRPDRPADPRGGTVLDGQIVEETVIGPVHTLGWQAAGSPAGVVDLEIDIAAGPYHDLAVNQRRDWRIRIPPEAVTILQAPAT